MTGYEKIDEPIEVIASFAGQRVIPHAFKWQRRRYTVRQVNLVHSERRGRDMLYYFAVNNREQMFNLCFDSGRLSWTLHEIFVNG